MSLTKKGALLITRDLDRIATVVTSEAKTLGIPEKVATGFSEWCDRISDRIERTAGIDPADVAAKAALLKQADVKTDYPFDKGKTFDGTEIGREQGGPMQSEADEPYMKGEFSQQENRELREKQEGGQLPGVNTEPRGPRSGVQASLAALTKVVNGSKYSEAVAAKVAEALNLAAEIAKSAADDEDEKEGEDEGAEDDKGKEASFAHGYNLNA